MTLAWSPSVDLRVHLDTQRGVGEVDPRWSLDSRRGVEPTDDVPLAANVMGQGSNESQRIAPNR